MTYIGLSMTFCMYLTRAQVPVRWKIFWDPKNVLKDICDNDWE